MRENAWLQFQNAGLDLSEFLWTDDDQPVVLPVGVVPAGEPAIDTLAPGELPLLNDLLRSALSSHPELLLYGFDLDVLAVEKKLRFQELLPVFNLRYNQLGKGYDVMKTAYQPLLENNYQYGLSFSIPFRLSKGRGEYRKVRLRMAETILARNLKRLQIENRVKAYYNELAAVKKQVSVQEKAYRNFLALQRAEQTRFQIGESSLFLVNARESKALEALQKLQELKTKYRVAANSLQWAAGLLVN
jgi:outer membrane protein TolC